MANPLTLESLAQISEQEFQQIAEARTRKIDNDQRYKQIALSFSPEAMEDYHKKITSLTSFRSELALRNFLGKLYTLTRIYYEREDAQKLAEIDSSRFAQLVRENAGEFSYMIFTARPLERQELEQALGRDFEYVSRNKSAETPLRLKAARRLCLIAETYSYLGIRKDQDIIGAEPDLLRVWLEADGYDTPIE